MLWRHALAHSTAVAGRALDPRSRLRKACGNGWTPRESPTTPTGRCRVPCGSTSRSSRRPPPKRKPRLLPGPPQRRACHACAASLYRTRDLEAGCRRVRGEHRRCRAGADSPRACASGPVIRSRSIWTASEWRTWRPVRWKSTCRTYRGARTAWLPPCSTTPASSSSRDSRSCSSFVRNRLPSHLWAPSCGRHPSPRHPSCVPPRAPVARGHFADDPG